MNKKELVQALKPLIKQCIREVVFEEGFLSNIIFEVVKGVAPGQVMLEEETKVVEKKALPKVNKKKLNETKKRMLDAVGNGAYQGVDLFEGTTPMDAPGHMGGAASPSSPMGGLSPTDPGVDISELFNLAGHRWDRIKKGK